MSFIRDYHVKYKSIILKSSLVGSVYKIHFKCRLLTLKC